MTKLIAYLLAFTDPGASVHLPEINNLPPLEFAVAMEQLSNQHVVWLRQRQTWDLLNEAELSLWLDEAVYAQTCWNKLAALHQIKDQRASPKTKLKLVQDFLDLIPYGMPPPVPLHWFSLAP